MKQRILLLFLLIFSGSAAAAVRTILVVGDSLSAGYGIALRSDWVTLLQQRLAQQGYPYRVINASISGDTTSSGRERLPSALARHRPEIVIIELGANDGLRGLALSQMRANLSAMIAAARGHGAKVLLVGMYLPPNYGKPYTERFHQIYVDLARKFGLPLVPFLLEGVALQPDLMQADGLHPRAPAEPMVLDNVWRVLKTMLRTPVSVKANGSTPPDHNELRATSSAEGGSR